jgi:hypothetical protein
VRIPRLEVVALERVAAREGRAVDALLARELLDFVWGHAEWLEGEIPGFAAALAWPEPDDDQGFGREIHRLVRESIGWHRQAGCREVQAG